ncbi:MAG TPA: DUF2249 domain-containing protein [Coriobacteriia bacterium]|nr:DUF2249 domain-containing protein [Coriobacteriia bacterium]
MAHPAHSVVLDVRACTPEIRRPLVLYVVDKLLAMDAPDSLLVVTDHEPTGIGYQIDLRRETRGKFEYFYDRRLDGAWVALIRRKEF